MRTDQPDQQQWINPISLLVEGTGARQILDWLLICDPPHPPHPQVAGAR